MSRPERMDWPLCVCAVFIPRKKSQEGMVYIFPNQPKITPTTGFFSPYF